MLSVVLKLVFYAGVHGRSISRKLAEQVADALGCKVEPAWTWPYCWGRADFWLWR